MAAVVAAFVAFCVSGVYQPSLPEIIKGMGLLLQQQQRRCQIRSIQYRPKGVLGKGVGNNKNASEIRQNASKMHQKYVEMGLVLLGKRERSKMRQK